MNANELYERCPACGDGGGFIGEEVPGMGWASITGHCLKCGTHPLDYEEFLRLYAAKNRKNGAKDRYERIRERHQPTHQRR